MGKRLRGFIRVCLVTGMSGAGKSTMISSLLKNSRGIRAEVIGNTPISELPVGCSFVQRSGDLSAQLGHAAEGDVNYVVIEASESDDPVALAQAVVNTSQALSEDGIPMYFDNVAAVFDAADLYHELKESRKFIRPEIGESDREQLMISQLEFCNTIVLNKTDLLSENDLDELKAMTAMLQTHAGVTVCVNGEAPEGDIFNTNRFEFQSVMSGAGWVTAIQGFGGSGISEKKSDFGLSSFVYYRRRPFIHDKLAALCDYWPHEIIRCKGMVWYAEERDVSFMFEQMGRQITESPSGGFLASQPKAEQERILRMHPQLRNMWDETYGDRMIKLVFIGQNMKTETIIRFLDMCLGE